MSNATRVSSMRGAARRNPRQKRSLFHAVRKADSAKACSFCSFICLPVREGETRHSEYLPSFSSPEQREGRKRSRCMGAGRDRKAGNHAMLLADREGRKQLETPKGLAPESLVPLFAVVARCRTSRMSATWSLERDMLVYHLFPSGPFCTYRRSRFFRPPTFPPLAMGGTSKRRLRTLGVREMTVWGARGWQWPTCRHM